MSLYLGDTLITPTFGNNYSPLLVGPNAKFLYEARYSTTLDQTTYSDSYNTLIAGNTNCPLYCPPTTYTPATANTANRTFDRWGNSADYHNGTTLDFAKYNYFVLLDNIVLFSYNVDSTTMGIVHVEKQFNTAICWLNDYIKVASNAPYPPSASSIPYGTTYLFNVYATFTRNASNVISQANQGSYGVCLQNVAPTLGTYTSASKTYPFINFRIPSLVARSHASSYMVPGAWQYLNAAQTTLESRQRLYRVDRPGPMENIQNRFYDMYIDEDFPNEVL